MTLDECERAIGHIIDRLCETRQRRQYTQACVAHRLGLSSGDVVSKYERHMAIPTLATIIRMAALYKVSLSWIMTGMDADMSRDHIGITARLARSKARDLVWILDELDRLGGGDV